MMSLVAVGVLILSALSILCFAAYKIRAKCFEVSTSVGKVVSFSIKIISADPESCESARDRVELLGRDARTSVGDEVSLPNGAHSCHRLCATLRLLPIVPMMASGRARASILSPLVDRPRGTVGPQLGERRTAVSGSSRLRQIASRPYYGRTSGRRCCGRYL